MTSVDWSLYSDCWAQKTFEKNKAHIESAKIVIKNIFIPFCGNSVFCCLGRIKIDLVRAEGISRYLVTEPMLIFNAYQVHGIIVHVSVYRLVDSSLKIQ